MFRMERTFSDEFKKYFLLRFTKELIVHSAKVEIVKLQKIIELEEKNENPLSPSINDMSSFEELIKPRRITPPRILKLNTRQFNNPILNLPEPRLPPHLEYLKPIPTHSPEIDLFKLNPLIKDPAVKIISGSPDEKVTVTGAMGTKPTGIVLSKEDINRIINVFSEESKIPVNEGIYKVVVGTLILSAVISEMIGSRFVIKKMPYYIPPNPSQRKI